MKDDREIRQGIRVMPENSRVAKVFGAKPETLDADLDEVAAMYSQDELDRLVESGVLAGGWKSAKKAETKK